MFLSEQEKTEAIAVQVCERLGVPSEAISFKWVPIPFAGEWGISTSFFQMASQEARMRGIKINVAGRAQEIAEAAAEAIRSAVGSAAFQRVEAVKGYLNLYYSTTEYSRRLVDTVLEQGRDFGRNPATGQRMLVEFSQPNTHKAFHVGHLRNAILGEAICKILEAAGHEVIRANYIGDIGLHVIKWMWCYLKNHKGERPGDDKTRWMGDIYAEADRLLADHPELDAEVRALFARWDGRDPDIVRLWEETRQWSLEGFDQIYERLGVRFDRVYFESEEEEEGKEWVKTMIERGIAVDERPDGPVIVRIDEILGLQKEKYRVLVILRSDGTSLYATKDIPLAIRKYKEYQFDRSIYVIDVRQSFYLQQIYKTLEIMGYEWARNCFHLAYEMVNLPGNVTMSSRDGTVVLLEDLMNEAKTRAVAVVRDKNPALSNAEMDGVAEAVAMGAIKYPMLARENIRLITFDWASALDFNGQAAPYIQYAHVRANSILRRMESPLPQTCLPGYALDTKEIQLIDLISRFPEEIRRAADEYKTLHLTNLGYEMARAFNDFYQTCPVLKAEGEARDFRLRLTAAAKQALANLLALLGISAPEVM